MRGRSNRRFHLLDFLTGRSGSSRSRVAAGSGVRGSSRSRVAAGSGVRGSSRSRVVSGSGVRGSSRSRVAAGSGMARGRRIRRRRSSVMLYPVSSHSPETDAGGAFEDADAGGGEYVHGGSSVYADDQVLYHAVGRGDDGGRSVTIISLTRPTTLLTVVTVISLTRPTTLSTAIGCVTVPAGAVSPVSLCLRW